MICDMLQANVLPTGKMLINCCFVSSSGNYYISLNDYWKQEMSTKFMLQIHRIKCFDKSNIKSYFTNSINSYLFRYDLDLIIQFYRI